MRSDVFRASSAVLLAALGGAGLVQAAPGLRDAGVLPAPAPAREIVYTVINLTESFDAHSACPLDIETMRAGTAEELAGARVVPVYSPIADGPDVLTHEVEARLEDGHCRWEARFLYQGASHARAADALQHGLSAEASTR